MTYIKYRPFIIRVIKSDTFRKKYSGETLLEFYKMSKQTFNFKELLESVARCSNNYSKEFNDDLVAEIKAYKHDEKCIRIAIKASEDFITSYYHRVMPQYYDNLFNKYSSIFTNNELDSYERIIILWNSMSDNEKSIWMPPSKKVNPYIRFVKLYKNKVLEIYPKSSIGELSHIMGKLWNMILPNIRYAELLDVSNKAPYVEFSLEDKQQANLVNRTMVSVLLNKDRRALQTIKKFIHMKRFLKLCKSVSFNQYFWNPNNMGGRWHIRNMTKMLNDF
jgi:hypothetical protein